jgi:serine/threonine protein kinase
MGIVYRARQPHLDRLVAIKVLPADAGKDPSFHERFTREARALARLSHPHILTVHDFGQADGQSYFVMEYVDGTNLRQRLRAGPLPEAEAVRIVRQVCDALQYAHEEGIVHRDVKPENVFLDKKGRVKIADFGIAKLLTRKTGEFTLTGPWQVMGTFRYMAPEQLENPQELDQRADIYSVGVMLYELLTGSLPQGHFPLPSQKVAADRRLDAIVLKALEREPGARYQQAAEMKAALDELPSAPTRPAVAGRPAPIEDPTAALPAPEVPLPTPAAWAARVRWPVRLLALGGFLSMMPPLAYWFLDSMGVVRPRAFLYYVYPIIYDSPASASVRMLLQAYSTVAVGALAILVGLALYHR